jgi:hypothetical protein
MTIFDLPRPGPGDAMRLAKCWVPNSLQRGTWVKACQVKWDPRPTRILGMLRISGAGSRALSHWKPRFFIYSHTKDGKNKQKIGVGQPKEVARGNRQHLLLGTITGGIGLLQVLQDGACHTRFCEQN